METFVLTVLGADRPGLVDSLATCIERCGGNWERSEMARLGGRFAGIVQVSVPDDRGAELRRALEELRDAGVLDVTVEHDPVESTDDGDRVRFDLVGADRPGLVRAVTATLVELGANIEEFESSIESAPMDGSSLFRAGVTAVLPAGVDPAAVRDRLEALAGRLMVDVEIANQPPGASGR